MDYPLENLNPEKFQEFSQALIAREFSGTQCFPVAQPDGGRDAVSYLESYPNRSFIMFQVKFVRNPFSILDPHLWLLDILDKEVPKLKQQIPKGAKQYVLVTNIRGTAHPEVGSMDKLSALFDSEFDVPFICWWRDDICRRLDDAWDLKWAYSELMTGPDLIRAVVEEGLADSKERRSTAIKAFVKDQFDKDQEVRFKQVDLQNKILDLFIDVPIEPPHNDGMSGKKNRFQYHFMLRHIIRALRSDSTNRDIDPSEDHIFYNEFGREYFVSRDERIALGAATLLLHSLTQRYASRMVLEGAPGQGKSTITQYVCQVHRMKILRRPELQAISASHRDAPVRLPFRVDLRDLASWLGRRNPFSSEESDSLPTYWQKSLEAFLAAQVRYHSGGTVFEVDDLLAVAKVSSILLVFDGLDEVADITRRREVVDEITRGVSRLEENAASLQVIVTSRPAAFINSPGLPEESFPYFHLASVTRPLIEEYADKWLRARKLYNREAADVKKILKEKLDQPHLRDLARNTMQLTILLSLIHTRGSSLPDKRTALYDSYVELFFNRESEKSVIVREHRDLLINIHRYLAWILHTESEQGSNTGSITEERLHLLLGDYLILEGYDVSLAKTLFAGMVERVVALVSRVEGTYEFEVQPLREYFAARYLYETAPYSPTGNEKKGTKPDRFDAIARNFYWLNVSRFYAGCYSKGELSSLIDCLQELVNEEGYNLISHPRNLAAMLLSDWVFAQHPKSVQQVIDLILDGVGMRYILTTNRRKGTFGNELILSKQNGQDELVARCFSVLNGNPTRDYALSIIELIKTNSPYSDYSDIWFQNTLQVSSEERNRWLEYGLNLGILSKLSLAELETLLVDDPDDIRRLSLLMRAKRFDYLQSSEYLLKTIVDAILDRDIAVIRHRQVQSPIELFCHCLDPFRYSFSFQVPQPVPLASVWKNSARVMVLDIDLEKESDIHNFEVVKKCNQIIVTAEELSKISSRDWSSELGPWDSLVEECRRVWGERWAFYHLASISSGIKSSAETCKDYSELFDDASPLCRRARYARLRAGTPSWWKKQTKQASNLIEKMFLVLLLSTWGSAATISYLIDYIDETLDAMPAKSWIQLYKAVRDAVGFARGSNKSAFIKRDSFSLSTSMKTISLMTIRLEDEDKRQTFVERFIDYQDVDSVVLLVCQQLAMDSLFSNPTDIPSTLGLISWTYKKIGHFDSTNSYSLAESNLLADRLGDFAHNIASHPDDYPAILVGLAESKYKETVASKIIPVGEIAYRDKWFEQ